MIISPATLRPVKSAGKFVPILYFSEHAHRLLFMNLSHSLSFLLRTTIKQSCKKHEFEIQGSMIGFV